MAKQPKQIRYVWLTPGDFLHDRDFRSWDSRLCGAYWCLLLALYTNNGKVEDDLLLLKRDAQWRGPGFAKAWKPSLHISQAPILL